MSRSRNPEGTFHGNILNIRAVEDAIRATGKYTEAVKTIWQRHPVQGEGLPSKMLTKVYEVYPDMDINKKRPLLRMSAEERDVIDDTLDWLFCDTPCISVSFQYDYRYNTATVIVKDGTEGVKKLAAGIPNFSQRLAEAVAKQYAATKQIVDATPAMPPSKVDARLQPQP